MVKAAIRLLTVLAAVLSVAAAAGTGGLRIDGVFLPQASLDLLWAGLPNPAMPSDFEAGVIDNRLLADWVGARLPMDALSGIDGEVEAEVMRLLVAQFPQTAMPAATTAPIDEEALRRVLIPSLVQGGFKLTPEQRQQAAALILMSLPPAERPDLQVTLLDVFERESIHGLAELRAMRRDYLLRQATALLQQRWQLWRWQQEGRFDASTLAGLTRIVRDKQLKQRWLQEQGLVGDVHHEGSATQARWREASEAAIKQYYEAHRDGFLQVDHVEADVLLLESQADADARYAALRGGLSFVEAVQRYGIPGSGTLGTIRNDATANTLLKKLALLQQKGVSRPFRVAERWAIYQVRERHERLLPLSDASVRHECARAVAKEQAQSEFYELSRRLRRAATIQRVSL